MGWTAKPRCWAMTHTASTADPAARIVGQRLTAHRHHGQTGTGQDALPGIGAQRRACVPFSEVGHHLGAAQNIQLDQVGRIEFQAADIDARVL